MPRLRPTRLPELMSDDRAELDALFASTVLGHVAFVDEGSPVVMPTAVVQWHDHLLVHGSSGSRWMRLLATGVEAAVSIAVVDGLVVARSSFESAVIYRSAVAFGSFTRLTGTEKSEALDTLTERLLPGRLVEVRSATTKELAATLVLALPLDQWSLRMLDEWPADPAADVAGPAWAGLVRFGARPATAEGSPDLSAGIDVPPSVTALLEGSPLRLS
jgi:uncharacterized protein